MNIRIGIIGSEEAMPTIVNYHRAVSTCGAETVKIASPEGETDFDGLLIPGGADVDPARYHETNENSFGIDTSLDDLELKMIDDAVKAGKPVLGICRGHQILNVYFGGNLIQHIPQAERHVHTDRGDSVHGTRIEKPSFLFDIYGKQEIFVNSAHHQAVKETGKGLRAVQFSDDGVIEAMEHEILPVYSVQWHPERMSLEHRRTDTVDGMPLFKWFISLIASRRGVSA